MAYLELVRRSPNDALVMSAEFDMHHRLAPGHMIG